MRLDDVFTDGQAQAGSTLVAAPGRIGTVKPFKDPGEVLFFNADTIVTDLYQRMPAIGGIHACHYCPIRLAIFTGIFYQVGQYLPDFSLSA